MLKQLLTSFLLVFNVVDGGVILNPDFSGESERLNEIGVWVK